MRSTEFVANMLSAAPHVRSSLPHHYRSLCRITRTILARWWTERARRRHYINPWWQPSRSEPSYYLILKRFSSGSRIMDVLSHVCLALSLTLPLLFPAILFDSSSWCECKNMDLFRNKNTFLSEPWCFVKLTPIAAFSNFRIINFYSLFLSWFASLSSSKTAQLHDPFALLHSFNSSMLTR